MNYIAHLHLAEHTDTSLLGNFLGDFVKGTQLQRLDSALQQGVWLHRKLDSFTDSHADIVALKHAFPGHLRRFAGIAIDIYFDHLLLQEPHWSDVLHEQQVFARFYAQLNGYRGEHGEHFRRVRENLLRHQWLLDYQHAETCYAALQRVEQRFRKPVQFAEGAFEVLQSQHHRFENCFRVFYPQLLNYGSAIADDFQPSNHPQETPHGRA